MKKQAYNPFLPSYEYIPDGEPHVFDGRVYLYGSHDRFDGACFCPNDYVCWSAPVEDLGNWRREGTIYKKEQDPLNRDGEQNLFAPDVCRGADGRYYLYYALNHAPVISVAVCDTPAGKYEFYGHVRYADGHACGTRPGEVHNFDPGVFRDEDGSVYLYTGFAPLGELYDLLKQDGGRLDGGYCAELEADMLTLKAEPVLLLPGKSLAAGTDFEAHPFFEASSMRKINGKYYYIYSSTLSHELCYAVSDRPNGGFVFGGTLISIGDIGFHGNERALNYTGNTHGSLIELSGEWYVFYHRQTNRHMRSRQGCAERVVINADGSICQAEMTSCGLNGGPLLGEGEYEASIACNLSAKGGTCMSSEEEQGEEHPYFTQSGEDREENPDQYIANLKDGAWCAFKYFTLEKTEKIRVTLRGCGEGKMLVCTEREGEPAAELPVRLKGEWETFEADFSRQGEGCALYFIYKGTGSCDFKSFCLTTAGR